MAHLTLKRNMVGITGAGKLGWVWLFCLISACSSTPKDDNSAPPPLFPQPQCIIACPSGGYVINQVTGDSIKPIMNSLGDTVQTGVWLKAGMRQLHPDSISLPTVFAAPTSFNNNTAITNQGVKTITSNKSLLNPNSKKRTLLGRGKRNTYIINQIGDTVKTGVAIPNRFFTIQPRNPNSVNALPPVMRKAANTNIQNMDLEQGLNSLMVLSIIEDKHQNIWIGYWGGGISIFNGESLKHFTEKEGLPSSIIYQILQDSKGKFWFASWGNGIFTYDGQTIQRYSELEGALSNHVRSLFEDSKGNIWFPSLKGVTKYDGKSFTHYTEREGANGGRVDKITEDNEGRIWFGNANGTIDIFDGQAFTNFSLDESGLTTIIKDRKGAMWVGTYNGIFNIKNDTIEHISAKDGLSDSVVFTLFEDSKGQIWVGTLTGGVNVINGRTISYYNDNNGLTNNIIFSFNEDSKGNIWIGSYGEGLFILEEGIIRHISIKDGLSDYAVNRTFKDRNGNYWFTTEKGGINKYDGQSFKHLSKADGLESYRVWPVIEDRNGDIWFGTWHGGAYAYDGKNIRKYGVKQGLSSKTILTMLEDRNKKLWFGTFEGGISVFDGKTIHHITEKDGLSNSSVLNIHQDKKGNFWFGTVGGGVSVFNGTHIKHFSEKEGLGNNVLRFIHEDQDGIMWFGTMGAGISLYDGECFTHLTEKEGLSDNHINAILEDQNHHIWVGGSKGLTRITRTVLSGGKSSVSLKDCSFTMQVFRQQDGLKGIDIYLQSAFIDSTNRSWWGSGRGLIMIDHNKFKLSEQAPKVILKQIKINNNFIDFSNYQPTTNTSILFSGVQAFENYPLDLNLPYHTNHLTFQFSAIDWNAPHKIHYAFRILGLNDKWSNPTKDPIADYRNLPFGVFTFQVRAIGESGQWSEPFSYTFTIRPPWWQTWWAYLAYVLFFLMAVRIFIRLRVRKLNAEKVKLEKTVEERTAELSSEKKKSDDLLLNILPEEVAEELKAKGSAEAKQFDMITVLFTDFKGFTKVSENMTPKELVQEMHTCFESFDRIMEKYGIEKIKTIGDAYMAAGGLPIPTKDAVENTVLAALEMQEFIFKRHMERAKLGELAFEMRVGIHSGPVVAGIVGVKKFQYDIWGDTVNTANRMESSGEVGKVNISGTTYELVKDKFTCTYRGKIKAKNKGELDMYYVERKS